MEEDEIDFVNAISSLNKYWDDLEDDEEFLHFAEVGSWSLNTNGTWKDLE